MTHRLTRISAVFVAAAAIQGCAEIRNFLGPLGDPAARVTAVAPIGREQLEPLSRNYFALETAGQTIIGENQVVLARAENTFSELAREYGLGYDELVAANPGIDPWLPGEGTPILLPTQYVLPDVPRQGIVLNIASKRLFYFPPAEAGAPQTVMTYPIGIGRVGWETPLGASAVVSKATDPHWWVPASVRREHEALGDPLPAVVPPGPDNPLGRHVLKLGLPGYLIHGTNMPYGVGMRVSHGCVRLYPENIEVLYDLVGVGEPVLIVNEPYLVGEADGVTYFEAHAPLEDDLVPADARMQAVGERLGSEDTVARQLASAVAGRALGMPVAIRAGALDNLVADARMVRNTVEPDPNMPTLAEVRAILDAPADDVEALANE